MQFIPLESKILLRKTVFFSFSLFLDDNVDKPTNQPTNTTTTRQHLFWRNATKKKQLNLSTHQNFRNKKNNEFLHAKLLVKHQHSHLLHVKPQQKNYEIS